MSTNKSNTDEPEIGQKQKWVRRETKQRRQMKVHGQGMKKLAGSLNKKKADKTH